MQLAVSIAQKSSNHQHAVRTINLPNETVINSFVIELDAVTELRYEDAEYTAARLLSDVGGSLGFCLGLSAPTFIMLIDTLMQRIWLRIK